MELDLVIADLDGPRAANVGLLRGVRRLHPQAVLIVFLPPGGLGEALRELGKLGVYRILSKPWSREELRLTVRLALRCRELLREHTRLQVRAGERLAALREVAAETN
jgi:two-component system NtrC family response regulator